ncbi:TonB-dependent receptor domain-containing protein [Pedobacter sp. UC225_61]|uniref:TonB-dependent receptor domain-containing protein n=1 Tax=Pedobacter sp. UC225_61 TaxID=3374623 RepID=UPI00379D4DDF
MRPLLRPILIFILFLTANVAQARALPRSAYAKQLAPARDIRVSGKVTDNGGHGLENANVTISSALDTTVRKRTLSGPGGNYVFVGVPAGRYIVTATHLGHVKGSSDTLVLVEGGTLVVPPIALSSLASQLAQVTIISKKPLFERRADMTIVNVGSSALAAGGSASDILAIAPGVSLDDNQISLKGKQGVGVMIDGKLQKLSGAQLASLLQGMPASSIDRIELIANPSARYDAQGKGGIINIRTKKGANLGFNGTLSSSVVLGRRLRPGAGAVLNYKFAKLNVFGSYAYQHNRYTSTYLSDKVISERTPVLTYHQDQSSNGLSDGHNASLGADYTISDKLMIGFLATRNQKKGNSGSMQHIFFGSKASSLGDSSLFSGNMASSDLLTSGFSVNSRHVLSAGGQLLLLDADHTRYRSTGLASFENSYRNASGVASGRAEHIDNDASEKIDLTVLKADYSPPLTGGGKLEAGLKAAFTRSYASVAFRSDRSGALVVDNARSNAFAYREIIGAGYLNYSAKFGKGTEFQAGLRAEQTHYTGSSPTTGQAAGRNYLNLFPSLSVQQALGENSVGFSYSRRIGRPDYEDLNPFTDYTSPYFYSQGNPLLRPETTHGLELSYGYHQKLDLSLGFSRTNDYYNYFTALAGSSGATRQTVDNFDHYDSWNLSASYSGDLLEWWTLTTNGDLSYDRYRTPYLGVDIDVKQVSYSFQALSSFRIGKALTAELIGLYRSNRVQLARTIDGKYRVDAALKYAFAGNRATFKTGVTDIFYTFINKGTNAFQGLYGTYYNRNENRRFNLSLSYRFGGGATALKKSRVNQEELDRIKQ